MPVRNLIADSMGRCRPRKQQETRAHAADIASFSPSRGQIGWHSCSSAPSDQVGGVGVGTCCHTLPPSAVRHSSLSLVNQPTSVFRKVRVPGLPSHR